MTTQNPDHVFSVPLDKLLPPVWNSRTVPTDKEAVKKEGAALAALAETMRSNGQQTPIRVTGPDENGVYTTVFGDRRRRAAISIGWTEIKALPATPGSDPDEDNIIENLQRSDLTTFQRARSLSRLVEKGKNQKQAALSTGITPGHVSKLLTAYKGLPEPVLKEWEADHPAADYAVLYEIATKHKTDEDKVKAWDAHVKVFAKRAESANRCKHEWDAKDKCKKCGEQKGATNAGYPVSQKALKVLIGVVKSKAFPEATSVTKKDLVQMLDFIVKGRKTVPDWVAEYLPKDEPEGDEDGDE